jgi:hypothetical protein
MASRDPPETASVTILATGAPRSSRGPARPWRGPGGLARSFRARSVSVRRRPSPTHQFVLVPARELGEQCLQLAEQGHDTGRLLEAHQTLWTTRLLLGSCPLRTPAENAIPMNVALMSIHVIIKDGRIFMNLLNWRPPSAPHSASPCSLPAATTRSSRRRHRPASPGRSTASCRMRSAGTERKRP